MGQGDRTDLLRATGPCKNCGKRVSIIYAGGRWYCAICHNAVGRD
jgi:hypothetical protein